MRYRNVVWNSIDLSYVFGRITFTAQSLTLTDFSAFFEKICYNNYVESLLSISTNNKSHVPSSQVHGSYFWIVGKFFPEECTLAEWAFTEYAREACKAIVHTTARAAGDGIAHVTAYTNVAAALFRLLIKASEVLNAIDIDPPVPHIGRLRRTARRDSQPRTQHPAHTSVLPGRIVLR